MRITRTLWSPDICQCQIYEFYDADLPPNEQVITSKEVSPEEHGNGTVRCDAHKKHEDAQEHYEVVLEECQRKSDAHFIINGGQIPIDYRFEGESPNRVLHIYGDSVLQSKIDKHFSNKNCSSHHLAHTGKVVLH